MRIAVVGLFAVLCVLAVFSVATENRSATLSRDADRASTLSSTYQDVRHWVDEEQSLEREYRLAPAAAVRRQHTRAQQSLTADLRRLLREESSANLPVVKHLLTLDGRYGQASGQLLHAAGRHNRAFASYIDRSVVEPVFGALRQIVERNVARSSRRALAQTAKLRRNSADATRAIALAFELSILLLLGFGLLITYFRRRLDAALHSEFDRLAEVAVTDPLTGLRNHRAFHEDLARSLERAELTGVPVSLVMLDLDNLKETNDTLGHQAGDERLRALTEAILATEHAGGTAYRVGGDEFAVILERTRAWNALAFTEALDVQLSGTSQPGDVSVSAGISERRELSAKDDLIREADLAMLAAKRSGQHAAIFTSEMDRVAVTSSEVADERHTRTLASALALAVDAKDSYTRSHSQTVSQLSALIAAELGFDSARIARVRLAGLLHDVGKIGIPDAILTKPAALTADEYRQMKTHARLGYEIVLAAGLPIEARWIRHHHERFDGQGYPDQIGGERIPLESRIVFVADSYEAMTSDRPYRKAPGHKFALAELSSNSGTQFDPEVVEALHRALGEPVIRREGDVTVVAELGRRVNGALTSAPHGAA